MTRWSLVTLWIALVALPTLAAGLSDEQAYKFTEALHEASRYGRSGNYKRAFDAYEKALQYNPEATDVYYNLVAIGEAMKLFDKVYLYATGYLAVAGEGSDEGREILAKQGAARKQLKGLGKLSVQLDQVGAVVTVNDVYLGTSPLREVELPAGTYRVGVTLKDYHPGTVEARVTADAALTVTLKLDEIIYYGTLVITTKPEAGVSVYVDDKLIGVSPLAEPLKVQANREHVVRFELAGHDTWTRAVIVAPDKPSPVEATLEKPPAAGESDESW